MYAKRNVVRMVPFATLPLVDKFRLRSQILPLPWLLSICTQKSPAAKSSSSASWCSCSATTPPSLKFISIQPLATKGSDEHGSYAGHNRCPSRQRGSPSTVEIFGRLYPIERVRDGCL